VKSSIDKGARQKPECVGRHSLGPPQAGAPQRVQKIVFDLGKFAVPDARLRHQHQIHRLGQVKLMRAKNLPQQPPRPGANHRIAELLGRDDPQPGLTGRGQNAPVGDEAAGRQSSAFLACPGKIPRLFEALMAPKRQSR